MIHAFSAAATSTATGESKGSDGRAALRVAHADLLGGWDGWQDEVRLRQGSKRTVKPILGWRELRPTDAPIKICALVACKTGNSASIVPLTPSASYTDLSLPCGRPRPGRPGLRPTLKSTLTSPGTSSCCVMPGAGHCMPCRGGTTVLLPCSVAKSVDSGAGIWRLGNWGAAAAPPGWPRGRAAGFVRSLAPRLERSRA